ncbi:MAG: FAD-binding oxidoreductase [Verrucomicrobiota bacterium]
MSKSNGYSWGRLTAAKAEVSTPAWHHDLSLPENPTLPLGLGRSYGDSCQLSQGQLIDTTHLNRLIDFDEENGLLRAEAGISLDAILSFCVPRGWFLPTTPGTRQVTLGGAIANDIHGKNHHQAGCMGNHVPRFELLRSDGQRVLCEMGHPLHSATIGGLGLTGLLTWAEVQLVSISSAYVDAEQIKFQGLDEFQELSQESESTWEHTVAWIDCLAPGCRGIFIRGNWSSEGTLKVHREAKAAIPVDFPEFVLNKFSIQAFNTLYYRRLFKKQSQSHQHYAPFFHPLDALQGWNRIYGKRGFYQYQCVTPIEAGAEPMREILKTIQVAGQGSFLAVLKRFGDRPSPGLLSFPREGLTLALDFPNRGEASLKLFEKLDQLVRDSGGRLYPAKDARMSAEDFHHFYPQLEEFTRHLDPNFTSDFWSRMTQS